MNGNGVRSKRLKALDGMRRTLHDQLHSRVDTVARARGLEPPPEDTSSIYTLAAVATPGLLDQLFQVHFLACQERGEPAPTGPAEVPVDEVERKRMLSVVRATVNRARLRTRQ